MLVFSLKEGWVFTEGRLYNRVVSWKIEIIATVNGMYEFVEIFVTLHGWRCKYHRLRAWVRHVVVEVIG